MTIDTTKTVRQIAIENPASVRIFESLGIDYCCGGRRPLAEACEKANVPLAHALELLNNEAANSETIAPEAWTAAPLDELINHIISQHHGYVRQELPRLNALLEKVVSRHGPAHAELASIQDLFKAMSEELFAHLLKEEQILFPFIKKM